jgi:hypothetical protein
MKNSAALLKQRVNANFKEGKMAKPKLKPWKCLEPKILKKEQSFREKKSSVY